MDTPPASGAHRRSDAPPHLEPRAETKRFTPIAQISCSRLGLLGAGHGKKIQIMNNMPSGINTINALGESALSSIPCNTIGIKIHPNIAFPTPHFLYRPLLISSPGCFSSISNSYCLLSSLDQPQPAHRNASLWLEVPHAHSHAIHSPVLKKVFGLSSQVGSERVPSTADHATSRIVIKRSQITFDGCEVAHCLS